MNARSPNSHSLPVRAVTSGRRRCARSPRTRPGRSPTNCDDGTAREIPMSVTDELLRNNERYAEAFDSGDLPMPPAKHVAVVACMDARLNVYGLLGLSEGDAHVIRNACGTVADDVIRSLVISQRLLGTNEIILVHHSDCGMLTFTDVDEDVRQSMARIHSSPFIPHKNVRGFVYEVENGTLREIV